MVAIEDTQATDSSVELLREFERTGRSEPFEAFMRRHAAMVYATCLKVTRDPHDAEDATQATFLTLASKSRLNGEIRQPEAWLRKVAHRLSLDLIRSKKRRINRENLRSEMTSEEAPLDSSDHAGQGEMKGILNEELAKLPASYRMPLVLHYFGGLSREEMADQLKLKPSTLGVRLHRAREQLRKRLSARGIALPTVALTALLTEVVRESVCSHIMTSTAHQASAIAMGQASAPIFTAGPGVQTMRLLTDLIGGSKLKFVSSLLVLASAISVTSGQVQQFLPKIIRDFLPTLRMPSIPKLEFTVPVPRLTADAMGHDREDHSRPNQFALIDSIPWSSTIAGESAIAPTPRASTWLTGAVSVQATNNTYIPQIESPVGSASAGDQKRITRTYAPAAPMAVAVSPAKPLYVSSAGGTTAAPSRAADRPDEVGVDTGANSGGVANRDAWNSVIPSPTQSAVATADNDGASTEMSAPVAPLTATPAVTDAPAHVVAAVVGSVPSLGSGGGAGGSSGDAKLADSSHVGSATNTPAASAVMSRVVASRTETFTGATSNLGGYADSSWNATTVADLSGAVMTTDDSNFSFSAPVVPGEAETLSINGARITLHNATAEVPVDISFVDTAATAIPTLPKGHHFIGVWGLETAATYDAVDLLVRYDDLRAARMGLSEQILKLWVSDGESWTLMWNDPTFGRDAYQNLLWVTADSDVKYFAVSAPEPTTLTVLVAAGTLLGRRRRPV